MHEAVVGSFRWRYHNKTFIIDRMHEQLFGFAIYVNDGDRLIDISFDELLYFVWRHELIVLRRVLKSR
jgi:hypothetical protein